MKKIKIFVEKVLFKIGARLHWIIFKLFMFKPNVMSPEKTISYILDKKLSISRFGEGEFKIMAQKGKIGFQDCSQELSSKLLDAFKTRDDRLLICSYNFKLVRPMNVESGRWLRNYVFLYYRYLNFFDKEYYYGDSEITRFYQPDCYKYTNFEFLSRQYIPLLKRIWDSRNILIVEGEETKLGVGSDLFDNAQSIRRILCPPRNAFTIYNDILNTILRVHKEDELVLLSLGPTASVLAKDLCCDFNIQSIDIGHVDVVYLWFLNKSKNKAPIKGKHVNEAKDDEKNTIFIHDDLKWKSQIVEVLRIDGK